MKKSLIILNPSAHGDKAARLLDGLHRLMGSRSDVEIRLTSMPGDAEKLAVEGVAGGFDAIIAAGGDGTINEVVNGIVTGAHGIKGENGVTLGILPIGTMNVFAVELGIPLHSLEKAWEVILGGTTRLLDLPRCRSGTETRYFAQLAGIGLDAEVVNRTTKESKKVLGPLSYLLSLAQVACKKPPRITLTGNDGLERSGSFVLLGNGRYYGGPFQLFRKGSQTDGLLDVLVFQNQSHWDLLRYMHAIMMGQHASLSDVEYFQSPALDFYSEERVPFELDGEVSGYLPLSVTLERAALQVFAPSLIP